MVAVSYTYELRHGETIVATGHLTRETPLEVGERIMINHRDCFVDSIQPTVRPHEQRLVVQLRDR